MSDRVLSNNPYIDENAEVVNSKFGIYTEVKKFCVLENVFMDDFSYCEPGCIIQNAEIKKFVNIAADVRIGATQHPIERASLHHFTDRRKKFGFDVKDDEEFFKKRAERKVEIGNDVWIGHGAIIMCGIKIGDGAVIGSGSVVTKDIEPYSIVAGVSAKKIRDRFPKDVVEKLEDIKWWNWSYEKIKENFNDFLMDINDFISKHYEDGNKYE